MQIKFKDKARADEKTQHTQAHVNILKRPATPLLSPKCIFQTA